MGKWGNGEAWSAPAVPTQVLTAMATAMDFAAQCPNQVLYPG
jgi:hypothetical protein